MYVARARACTCVLDGRGVVVAEYTAVDLNSTVKTGRYNGLQFNARVVRFLLFGSFVCHRLGRGERSNKVQITFCWNRIHVAAQSMHDHHG